MTDRFMMATQATHVVGDISRDEPHLAVIYGEDDEHFIGQWVAGMGFINVHFPKTATRELTAEERARYAAMYVETGGIVAPIGVTASEGTP